MSEKLKVAINGFGRIGRTFFRAASGNLDIIAINDLASLDQLIYLLKYDSAYGTFSPEVKKQVKGILVDGKLIPVSNEKDPANLPWDELDIDVVIESTGVFRKKEDAQKHLEAGAKRVLISAPAKGDKPVTTIVPGVNHEDIKDSDKIISMASCTTNNLTPVVKVLDEMFGIKKSLMTTIHSYTSSQSLQDGPNEKDFRRGRAAAENVVPTTTGASKATELAYPKVKDKLDGMAFRVPTATGSIIDLTALLEQEVTKEEVNEAFKLAQKSKKMLNAIGVTDEPLVTSDIKGDEHGALVDLKSTMALGDMVKVVAWYDNEMGYSKRMVRLIKYLENGS